MIRVQNEDLDLEDTEENQQLETSLHDLSIEETKEDLNKIPSQEYNILVSLLLCHLRSHQLNFSCKTSPLPNVIQADILQVPTVEKPLFKRTLADVKFQMAEQDNFVDDDADKEVVSMLNLSGNSDLIKGVYEGGFKTWECSIDMVQFLSGLPNDQISNKKVLEVNNYCACSTMTN